MVDFYIENLWGGMGTETFSVGKHTFYAFYLFNVAYEREGPIKTFNIVILNFNFEWCW